jgi:Protein of unknown function (DUF2817)
MMPVSQHFAATYAEARQKFRDAATKAGAVLTRYRNPTKGPSGEELTTDVARLGPAGAGNVLMTVSATHGAEGFCGSGIQIASFASGFGGALPKDTALVVVHAINPYGFAWLRRVTEENVDLNRNFVDHAKPLPRNDWYDELVDAICPLEWTEASLTAAQRVLDAFALKHGPAALQKAVSGGQYNDPDGIFYGGLAPSWARQTLLRIVAEHAKGARHLALIDYHTGLGPYGHGEQISLHAPGSAALKRAEDWYGTITNPALGTSSSAELHGDNLTGLDGVLAPQGIQFTGMALEYGTLPLNDVLNAVRADNWVHHHGDLESPLGQKLKRHIREAFYCDKDDWKDMLFEQGMRAQQAALKGLAG